MTFDQWVSTERRHTDLPVVESAFGHVPDETVEVLEYSPGVIVRLENGDYYTHVVRSEVTGGLDYVRVALWTGHAETETKEVSDGNPA